MLKQNECLDSRIYKINEGEVVSSDSYGYTDGANNFTNAAIRKRYASEWALLGPGEQQRLRSERARRGIKCSFCGAMGYYLENCANDCVNRPRTPDSLESTPPSSPPPSPKGLGVLWGRLGFGDDQEKTTLLSLRTDSLNEQKRLAKSDSTIQVPDFCSLTQY